MTPVLARDQQLKTFIRKNINVICFLFQKLPSNSHGDFRFDFHANSVSLNKNKSLTWPLKKVLLLHASSMKPEIKKNTTKNIQLDRLDDLETLCIKNVNKRIIYLQGWTREINNFVHYCPSSSGKFIYCWCFSTRSTNILTMCAVRIRPALFHSY